MSPDLFGGVGDARSLFVDNVFRELETVFEVCIWYSRAFLMFSTSGLVITDNSLVSDAGCELDTPSS